MKIHVNPSIYTYIPYIYIFSCGRFFSAHRRTEKNRPHDVHSQAAQTDNTARKERKRTPHPLKNNSKNPRASYPPPFSVHRQTDNKKAHSPFSLYSPASAAQNIASGLTLFTERKLSSTIPHASGPARIAYSRPVSRQIV